MTGLAAKRDSDESAEANLALASAGGWWAVGPTAIKLWLTLWRLGQTGHTTYEVLARSSGIGQRTVQRALVELRALGWLEVHTTRGKGLWYRILQPPATLQQSAADDYAKAITGQREHLAEREERLRRETQGHAERAAS